MTITDTTNDLGLGVAIQEGKDHFDRLFEGIDLDRALSPSAPAPFVRGHFVGYKLDNAFGNSLNIDAIREGRQEHVLVLKTYAGTTPKLALEGDFNVADLIAIIRKRIKKIEGVYPWAWETLFLIDKLTEKCRPDMHEPDEQDVVMFLKYPTFDTSEENPRKGVIELWNPNIPLRVEIDHEQLIRFVLAA